MSNMTESPLPTTMTNLNTTDSSEEDRILLAVILFMDVCIVVGNGFILYVVFSNWAAIRLKRKNRAAQLLTVNLCTADLFLATIDIYYMLTLFVPELSVYLIHHKTPCLITLTCYITGHMASGYTLVAIAVERYIYIVHGIRYAKIMTASRTLIMLSIVWLAAIFGTLPLYIWNNWDNAHGMCHAVTVVPRTYSMVATVGRIIFVIVAIMILHCRIHHKALQIYERKGPLRALAALRTRSARVVFIITIAYIISWIPYLAVFCCKKYSIYVPSLVFKFAECMITLNYLVNPFIYVFHNRPIHHAILETLRGCKRRVGLAKDDRIDDISREDIKRHTEVSFMTSTHIFNVSTSSQMSPKTPKGSEG